MGNFEILDIFGPKLQQKLQAAVQDSVEQLYSEVLSKKCATALNPKKIEIAVRRVAEKEDRSRNVIMYGLEEKDNEVVQDAVQTVLEQIYEKPHVKECYRVGVK